MKPTPENEAAAQAIVDAHYAELSRRINAKVDAGTIETDTSDLFTKAERLAFIHDAIVTLDPSKKDEYDEICQEPA